MPPVEDLEEQSDVVFAIIADADTYEGTKSCIPDEQMSLNKVDIFIYDSGVLRTRLCMNRDAGGSSAMTVSTRLIVGSTYDIIVVANNSVHTPPASLDAALNDFVYRIGGMDDIIANGIPMCGRETITVAKYQPVVQVKLKRLVADITLQLDKSGLQHGSLTINSVKVRQMNTVCPFFGDGRAQGSGDVTDGDLSDSNDMVLLNSGWETKFYVLENKQGTLLPNNTDPNLKNPARVTQSGGDPGFCTYIEVEGEYTDIRGEFKAEPVVTKFFLGEDACSNFDVNRNWRYNITLRFTDDVCFRNDWRSSCTVCDTRSLGFRTSYTELEPGEWDNIYIDTNISYEAGDYTYELSGDADCFDTVLDWSGLCFSVSALDEAPPGSCMEITVTSWDGALSASHLVFVR
ncbi:MAG: DUF4906 domain-containing protein [Bacteroidales bacterium]|nr:DUF4906 domain-containing protein [Bacteroidales bacterium]